MHQSLSVKVLHLWANKIFDHWLFIEQHPDARLVEMTWYGYNYVTAIEAKFQIPGEDDFSTIIHQGSMHDQAKKNEMYQETIILEENEQIETVNWWWSAKNQRIRSLTFGTFFINSTQI